MNIEDLLAIKEIQDNLELAGLLKNLHSLKEILDNKTLSEFKRINPFIENIFDWKQKGKQIFGEEKNITIYDTCTIVGNVQIGENTWIGPYSALDGQGGLTIGKGCSISSGVSIVSHDTVNWALSNGKLPYEFGAIEIGDNCFIGTNAIIRKGVRIGNQCVIGAGAVVTQNIPNNKIAMGVPARIVGSVLVNENNLIELKYE